MSLFFRVEVEVGPPLPSASFDSTSEKDRERGLRAWRVDRNGNGHQKVGCAPPPIPTGMLFQLRGRTRTWLDGSVGSIRPLLETAKTPWIEFLSVAPQ